MTTRLVTQWIVYVQQRCTCWLLPHILIPTESILSALEHDWTAWTRSCALAIRTSACVLGMYVMYVGRASMYVCQACMYVCWPSWYVCMPSMYVWMPSMYVCLLSVYVCLGKIVFQRTRSDSLRKRSVFDIYIKIRSPIKVASWAFLEIILHHFPSSNPKPWLNIKNRFWVHFQV